MFRASTATVSSSSPENVLARSHAGQWVEIPRSNLPVWNDRLLQTDASFFQFPYWNEPYRRVWFRPRYIGWGTSSRPEAYACILTVGRRFFRIGLILRGPVGLSLNQDFPAEALLDLRNWAQRNGYVFLRFTHSDPVLLDAIARLGPSERKNTFPFFEDTCAAHHELIVDQLDTDAAMLASFDREARRKIRRAQEAGYSIRFDDTPEALATVWPIFQSCSTRKGFHLYRSLDQYMEVIRLARPHKCAWVYTVLLNEKPVEASLVVRDKRTAFCHLAALDVEAVQGLASPSVLLHWQTMRDMYKLGVDHYSLGPGPGSVGFFKDQFSPRKNTYPPPVALIVNRPLYWLWKQTLPVKKWMWPKVKLMLSKIAMIAQRERS